MKSRTITLALLSIALATAAAYGSYRLGLRHASTGSAMEEGSAASDPTNWSIPQGEQATRRHIRDGVKAGDNDPVTGRAVLYYHDPMVPGKKFDAPAKSPFMDMMLVPVYAGGAGGAGADSSSVTVSPRIQQNLGLRTAEVVQGRLAPQVQAVGNIVWNERDQAVLQARATGFVERLHVRATLDRVSAGQPLIDLYVPAWVAAQEEFLALRRMKGDDLAPLIDAARARMRQVGMDDAQIALVESRGAVQPRLTLTAPIGGVVSELTARDGMTVMAGMTLLRINGTTTVWAQAEVPESQAALLRPGTRVHATSPALPGQRFDGRVQALLPDVDVATRTLKARMEITNRGNRLVPGMFVQMDFSGMGTKESLLVPTEAVIHTGQRSLVMVAENDGAFRPVDVQTGLEAGGRTEVLAGLRAGQYVVVSSQFLIDSEASLKGVETRSQVAPGQAIHRTVAKVEAVHADRLTLTHPPIASLKWPDMTMDFKLPKARTGSGPAVGAQVAIEFRLLDGEMPQITSMKAVAAGAAK